MDKPKVYQATDGRWIVFSNGIKSDYFINEEDAVNMATKITFATQAQLDATTMAQVADRLANLESVYFDRGYDGGGSNPIIDADITSLNITAADLAALITLTQQLANFLGNLAVTSGDYDATLNTVRTDV
jgi:hypothetical protein